MTGFLIAYTFYVHIVIKKEKTKCVIMNLQETTWAKKTAFITVCCTYFLVTGFLVNALSQKSPLSSEVSTPHAFIQDGNDSMGSTESLQEEDPTLPLNDTIYFAARGKKAEEILHPVITEVATEHELDPDLIKAIIWAESSFNPKAVSKKGAIGLMQLMPATARSLGVEDCMNPTNNIDAGVRYFKQLMIQFNGDEELALAAYNAGSSRVKAYNGIPPFEATQFYVKKVFEYYREFKDAAPQDIDNI